METESYIKSILYEYIYVNFSKTWFRGLNGALIYASFYNPVSSENMFIRIKEIGLGVVIG